MFYIPFWLFFATAVMLAGLTIYIRKLRFIDIQIMTMIVALSMTLDMIFRKHLLLYSYVAIQYKGWYSFWANFIICPAVGLIFIKFVPSKWLLVVFYTIFWSVALTLFELFITKPFGIVLYPKWQIFPWSTIGYIIVLIWEILYLKILKKHLR